MSIAVVVPTIREDCAIRWLNEWADDLQDARVILVEDNPEPTFALTGNVEHYSWADFGELGADQWIIPRRTSACRSFGLLKALEGDADIIWTTDDDCYPETARKGQYLDLIGENLAATVAYSDVMNGWWNTTAAHRIYPRGYPYRIREVERPVMIHHGLWSNVPDLDGITQLAHPDFRLPPHQAVDVVPEGALFPFCIMNAAFRRQATPLMYMLLMGKDPDGQHWGFDRFDDIWAGVLAKLTADHLGWAVTSGAPSVHHSRASDPHRNAALEKAGMAAHEDLWPYLRDVKLSGTTPGECYQEFAHAVNEYGGDAPRTGYWNSLAAAMVAWAGQCEKRGVA